MLIKFFAIDKKFFIRVESFAFLRRHLTSDTYTLYIYVYVFARKLT